MSQKRTPYLRALAAYADSDIRRFHLPGHQGEGGKLQELVARVGWRADTTAVLDLDDIHYPYGPLGEAQDLAAELYGARQTRFLVNGSTVGLQALALAFLREGDTVILPRNAHRSIHGAVELCGARPIYAPVPFDAYMGVYHALEVPVLARLLDEHPTCRACFLESPTPYGAVADVRGLVETVHRHGAWVVADEAWGAHLMASPLLPESACAASADAVVQSAHKTLTALGQGAWMHIYGSQLDEERLSAALRLLQTSSPSSLVLASLDEARSRLALRGKEDWEGAVRWAQEARRRIATDTPLSCPVPTAWAHDPTRLVVSGRELGGDGPLLECRLRYRHGIQVDMSDHAQALLTVTPARGEEDIAALVAALTEVGSCGRGVEPAYFMPPIPEWEEAVLTPRQAAQAEREAVPLEQAEGRISARRVVTYPPAMALLCPGEAIGDAQVEYLRQARARNVPVEGLAGDGSVYCVAGKSVV